MARTLSVAYDEPLLKTRELNLEHVKHSVTSALGFTEAVTHCQGSQKFDLFILGDSIASSDKKVLIAAFRAHCSAPIVALRGPGEESVRVAEFEIEPDPRVLVQLVKDLR